MSAQRSFVSAFFLVTAVLLFSRRLEAGRGPVPYLRPLTPYDWTVVERVRARAAARLDDPECGKLLTDFRDGAGRTLQSNLQGFGISLSQYLLQLSFLDGSLLPACRPPAVIMAVTPGVPRVFVCPAGVGRLNARFSQIELESGLLAEAMVIHEMLHTLGLGENPPSTFEITERVRQRCR
ncbi:MAG TPA: hypothetical protein VN375_07650 [Vicinamibacteria bacterium]|jgi:hypothetical protein|nr:hypothetical protein [Vicinamibacteria bacterium]